MIPARSIYGLALLAFLLPQITLATEPAARDKTPSPAPRDNGTTVPRKEAAGEPDKKPAAAKVIPAIEPRRQGDKLDLGLCDGS